MWCNGERTAAVISRLETNDLSLAAVMDINLDLLGDGGDGAEDKAITQQL